MINHQESCNVQTTLTCTCHKAGIDPARIRAAIRLLYPDEITPTAKRILERILDDDHNEAAPTRAAFSYPKDNE